MINSSALKNLLHIKGLHQRDKLLLLLSVQSEVSKSVTKIREIAISAGLREINQWNVSRILKSAKGLAISTGNGWELNDYGKEYVRKELLKETLLPFKAISLPKIDFGTVVSDSELAKVLNIRVEEIEKNLFAKAYLSAVIMMGSLLEGLLCFMVQKYPKAANKTKAAPKDKQGTIKPFRDWTLSDMINVSHEVGWVKGDVKGFSHSLRNYRNMIHPFQQKTDKEFPDEDSCKICAAVVSAALNDIVSVAP